MADHSNDGSDRGRDDRGRDGQRHHEHGSARRSGAPTGARRDGARDRRDGTSRPYRGDRDRDARREGGQRGEQRGRQDQRPRRDDRRGRSDDGRGGGRGRRDVRPDREQRDRRDDRGRRDDRDRRDGRGHRDDGARNGAPRDRGREGRRGGRPGEEQRADRPIEPRVPEGITGRELDKDTREELRGLSKETAERVGRHLVSAELLQYSDPETALAHARFAARLGGRVGVVREVHGIFAYHAGDYRTASRELRTAMRITGRTDVLPMIADCERGLGRPERALDIAASEAANDLGVEAAIELMMVVAGAYADTGDVQTALRTLEIPALRHKVDGRWQVRLWVAYADLLERADREDEARRWITLAADADTEGLTDAAERLGRPAPVPAEDPVWEGDEQISVLDAFDPEAEEEPDAAEPTDEGAEEHQESEVRDREAQPDEEASPASREEPA